MKKRLISIILIALVILEAVAVMALPASAASWSWQKDGRFAVASYNAPIVKKGSITLDAKLDEGYLTGTKITSYPDEEPYRRVGYEALWGAVRGSFEAYVALDENGLYIYAEIEDDTIHATTNDNGNDGDFLQIYLDWCPEDVVHPSSAEMYSMYTAGKAFDGKKYSNTYSTAGKQYIGYLSADYNGVIKTTGGFTPYDMLGSDSNESIIYKTRFTDDGWACEWFVPWRDQAQKTAIRNGEQFHLGIGFQSADDTDVNNTKEGEKDVGLSYDQRKEIGLKYWENYTGLADIVFIPMEKCDHQWKDLEVVVQPKCKEQGVTRVRCDKCEETRLEYRRELGHSTEDVICTVAKKKDVVCTRCGTVTKSGYTATVPEDAEESHVWEKAADYRDETCTTEGNISLECKYCTAENVTTTPPRGHTYSYSERLDRYFCEICGTRAPKGDADSDGAVTNADVLEIYRNIYDPETYPLDAPTLADIDGDGAVTNADVLEIYRYVYDPKTYPLEEETGSLLIDGTEIGFYTVVYPTENYNGEREAAKRLADHFGNTFGVIVEVSDKWDGEGKAIILGEGSSYITDSVKGRIEALDGYTLNKNNAMIASADNVLWIAATNRYTLSGAVDRLIELTTPRTAGDSLSVAFSNSENAVRVTVSDIGEELKIMSYNVQTGTPDATRVKNMIKNITDFMPDVIGMQEVNAKWIEHFESTGLLDRYTFVGEPRNGNKETDKSNGNEYSAIMFLTDKFNLIDSGTFWLSSTPTVPGSKHSSSTYIRIMTFVVLERKSDGKRFVHVNTHLSWDENGYKTNLIQINIMHGLVESEIYAEHGELPTYFTGDYNVLESSEGYAKMISEGYCDARYVSEVSESADTYPGKIIDFCFVSNGDFVVSDFHVGYGLAGSDHYPVYIKMYLN